jgi:hypothetical protein
MSTKKKAFFHYEAKGFETYTKSLFLREKESSVAEIIQTFTKSFQLDHPEIDLGRVEVTDASGNTFGPSDDLYTLLRSKDDCYVVTKKKMKAPAHGAEDASSKVDSKEHSTLPPPLTPSASLSTPATILAKEKKVQQKVISPAASTSGGGKQIDYHQLMSTVDDLITQKALRKARDICLDVISNSAYRNDTRSLENLCQIAFDCRKYDDAIRYGEQALDCFVETRGQLKKSTDNTPLLVSFLHILLTVARSQAELGDPEEALERTMQGLSLLSGCTKQSSSSSSLSSAKLSQLPATLFTISCSSQYHVQTVVLEANAIVPVTTPKSSAPHVISLQNALITLELV